MSSGIIQRLFADLGVNGAEALSFAIVKAAETKRALHEYAVSERLVTDAIILSATCVGSIYLLSTSISGLNKKWIKSVSGGYLFEILNGTVACVTAIVALYCGYKSFPILRRMQSGSI